MLFRRCCAGKQRSLFYLRWPAASEQKLIRARPVSFREQESALRLASCVNISRGWEPPDYRLRVLCAKSSGVKRHSTSLCSSPSFLLLSPAAVRSMFHSRSFILRDKRLSCGGKSAATIASELTRCDVAFRAPIHPPRRTRTSNPRCLTLSSS